MRADADDRPHSGEPRRPRQAAIRGGIGSLQDQEFDVAAGRVAAAQSSAPDSCVVDHKQVVLAKDARQIDEPQVLETAILANVEQP